MQAVVEKAGYSVVRDLVGHGIGVEFHEDPQVPNYGKPKRREKLVPGLTLAIEPMVNVGGPADQDARRPVDDRHGGRQLVGALRAYGGDHRRCAARVDSGGLRKRTERGRTRTKADGRGAASEFRFFLDDGSGVYRRSSASKSANDAGENGDGWPRFVSAATYVRMNRYGE